MNLSDREDMMNYRTGLVTRRALTAAIVALVLVGAGAADASAQLRFSVAGGPTVPLGSFGDALDTGFNAQLSAGLSVPILPVGIRVDGMLNQFPVTGGDDNFRVISGSVNGVLSLPSVGITPYLIGGLGLYNQDHPQDGSTTDVGANIGVGLRVGLPGLAVFGEARLHNIFNEGDAVRFAPLSLGVSF